MSEQSETLRVAVWNMAHKKSAWPALERLRSDVALLNEARVPDAGTQHNIVGGVETEGRDGYSRPWASAVVSRYELYELRDPQTSRYGRTLALPFENSRPGSWVAAVAKVPGLGDLTVISLYGLLDDKSDVSVHRSLSDLAPVLEDRRYRKNLLLGGDLNTWTGWGADSEHLKRDIVVLERIKAHGLVDCLELKYEPGRLDGDCPCSLGEDCRHTRTRLDPRKPEVPYQMDYLFASKAMADRLLDCQVPTDDGWPKPSDHYPIQAVFDL